MAVLTKDAYGVDQDYVELKRIIACRHHGHGDSQIGSKVLVSLQAWMASAGSEAKAA